MILSAQCDHDISVLGVCLIGACSADLACPHAGHAMLRFSSNNYFYLIKLTIIMPQTITLVMSISDY